MAFKTLSFLLAMSVVTLLWGDENRCTFIDLRDNEGLLEMRNQGEGSNWCYVMVAADLLSYKYQKQISAVDLYSAYKQSFGGNFISLFTRGGLSEIAISVATARGVCLEADLPLSPIAGFDLDRLDELFYVTLNVCGDSIECLKDSIWPSIFPHITPKEILKILQDKKAEGPLSRLSEISCQGRRMKTKAETPVVRTKGLFYSEAKMTEDLDRKLDQNVPVGVYYYHNILNYNYTPRKGPLHISSIVGRRFNDLSNECEYLVRDSYGKSCLDVFNQYPKYHIEYQCDKGNVWVPVKMLMNSATSIFYLKD